MAALATILPLADQYFALCADVDERKRELEEVERTTVQLPALRSRVAAMEGQLAELESSALPEAAVPAFRGRLVELARESGCQIRRIGLGSVRERRWRESDDPLADVKQKSGKETPFTLQINPVTLSVTGNHAQINKLLKKIESEDIMTHAKTLDLRLVNRKEALVQMDLELWCFALIRAGSKA